MEYRLTHRHDLAFLLEALVQRLFNSVDDHAHTLGSKAKERLEFAQVIRNGLFLGVRKVAVGLDVSNAALSSTSAL